jgi:hypothetical protein
VAEIAANIAGPGGIRLNAQYLSIIPYMAVPIYGYRPWASSNGATTFMKFNTYLFIGLILLAGTALAACSSSSQPGPVSTVETYQNALIAGDADQLVNASCAEWEAQALLELDSFTAVTTQLEDRICQEAGKEGDITLVACTGIIKANYGAEVLEIDLSDRSYQVIYEGGEWRMCGYR